MNKSFVGRGTTSTGVFSCGGHRIYCTSIHAPVRIFLYAFELWGTADAFLPRAYKTVQRQAFEKGGHRLALLGVPRGPERKPR